MEERPEGFVGRLTYNSDIFDASTIRRMTGHWTTLIEGALRDPNATLAQSFALLLEQERRLVAEAPGTLTARHRPAVHHPRALFESQQACPHPRRLWPWRMKPGR